MNLNGKAIINAPSARLAGCILIALWAGILTGIAEGAGLWICQRVNWARWGPMMHVSAPIVWISPIVDVLLFVAVALFLWLIGRAVRVGAWVRILAFAFVYLAIYDWLTLTNRLYRPACILLAIGVAVVASRWTTSHPERVTKLIRRTLPAVLALYFVALGGVQGWQWFTEHSATTALPLAPAEAPNVLVIVVDTLRADHVSAYGYSRPTTPNIDRLANEGVLFENAISPSSWSLPSHVSIITGRYLHDHGVGNVQPEPWFGWGKSGLGGFPTIGEVLREKGYRTGAFSANRTYFSSDLGFGRGFIHFEDYFNSPADAFVRTVYGREFARVYLKRSNRSLIKRTLRWLGWHSLLDQDAEGSGSYGGAFGVRKPASEVNREVMRWIDRDRQHPFFAFLNYFDVHDPYGGPSSSPKPAWPHASAIDLYDDGVAYVDASLGRLMDSLQRNGIAKNTFVIVTSDHGESLGQHYLMTHGRALYRELIRVPLILWYPGHLASGQRVDRPVSNVLIPATILSLTGNRDWGSFEGPSLTDGVDSIANPISELAENKYPGKHDEVADSLIPTAKTGSMKSLVTPDWQLIAHAKLGEQLYDWRRDPGEAQDLAKTPGKKEKMAQLRQQLRELGGR